MEVFIDRSVSGAFAAMVDAMSWTVGSSSELVTTRFIRPIFNASMALYRSPVKSISAA